MHDVDRAIADDEEVGFVKITSRSGRTGYSARQSSPVMQAI